MRVGVRMMNGSTLPVIEVARKSLEHYQSLYARESLGRQICTQLPSKVSFVQWHMTQRDKTVRRVGRFERCLLFQKSGGM